MFHLRTLLAPLLITVVAGCASAPPPVALQVPVAVEIPVHAPTVPLQIKGMLSNPPVRGKLSADPRFRPQVTGLYAREDYRPLWLADGRPTARADQAVALLEHAADEGLAPEDYRLADVKSLQAAVRRGQGSVAQQARFDLTLSFALARFVSDVRVGRVSPAAAGVNFDVTATLATVPRLVERALGEEPLPEVLSSARPPVPLYLQLRKVLPRYRAMATRDVRLPSLPDKLKPGERWAGVPVLAQRLALLGDYTGKPVKGASYQGDLVVAVKRFQERHGLQADGVIGAGTQSALTTSLDWRVRQMELSMERMRWMGLPDGASKRIVVNIPQYRLWAFEAGSAPAALSMAVMVGEPDGSETPVMDEEITSVVFSPYWNVPFRITRDEILPKLRKDPNYLVQENMEMVSADEVWSQPPDAERIKALAQGKYRLRQRPGPTNALGGVKFEFPNTKSIYMHDTQSRSLFARSKRSLSHGCIRLQHPQALAEFILDDQGWDKERVTAAMSAGKQERVRLRDPVPVLLFYNTTMVSLDGRVAFLEDIYGLDRKLDAALKAAPR